MNEQQKAPTLAEAKSGLNPIRKTIRSTDISSMICPFCSSNTPATWQPFALNTDEIGRLQQYYQTQLSVEIPPKNGEPKGTVSVAVQWLRCQNEACRELAVQIVRTVVYPGSPQKVDSATWFGLPKRKAPPVIDLSLVSAAMKQDYIEAFTILEDSPRMSAVLSRRILADLLKKYDSAAQYGLTARIDAFVANQHHPSRLRENLHYLREIADFGAHTQTIQAATPGDAPAISPVPSEEVVINATQQEAEWTLKVVADLFDYFIVAPKKDEALRSSFDKKLEAAGRKPIRKPTDEK